MNCMIKNETHIQLLSDHLLIRFQQITFFAPSILLSRVLEFCKWGSISDPPIRIYVSLSNVDICFKTFRPRTRNQTMDMD